MQPRRHREFISIFNLIRNSFATISQTVSSPARFLFPSFSPPPLIHPSVASLRAVDLSLDLFQRPPTSPLSLVAPASRALLPLYFPHGASLSLTPTPFFPSSFNSPRFLLPYRCRFPVPFTRNLSTRYLLRLPWST